MKNKLSNQLIIFSQQLLLAISAVLAFVSLYMQKNQRIGTYPVEKISAAYLCLFLYLFLFLIIERNKKIQQLFTTKTTIICGEVILTMLCLNNFITMVPAILFFWKNWHELKCSFTTIGRKRWSIGTIGCFLFLFIVSIGYRLLLGIQS